MYDLVRRNVAEASGASAGAGEGGGGAATGGAGGNAVGQEAAGGASSTGGAGSGASAGTSGEGGAGHWFGASPEDKAWAESKGWGADIDAKELLPRVADSYKNLEKLFGADKAGRTIMLPKDDQDTEALNNISTRLGKPDTPDKYEIALPEGADTQFADTFKGVFHKANLTTSQAKLVTEAYQAAELDFANAQAEALKQGNENLKKDWGQDYDHNTEVAKAAVKAAGLSDVQVQSLSSSLGLDVASKMFEFFGRNYVESGPVPQEGRTAPSFDKTTPAAATARIEALRADPNFMARYGHQDPKIREVAMKEMDDLSRLAFNQKRV